jgi:(p)ppGpp synthase/HD superfamily hydrolase
LEHFPAESRHNTIDERKATVPTIAETTEYVEMLFKGVTDKGGKPYAEHCKRVMTLLPDWANEDMRHAALLHDVLEDTDVTAGLLAERGYSERVIRMVQMLSRPDDIPYLEWIARLKATGDAEVIAVKLADNKDNSDPERVALLPEPERTNARRYQRAREILTEQEPKCHATN